MLLPKVIIKYGSFLDPIFREYFLLKPENKDKILIEKEDLLKNIEDYKKEWKIYEERILTGLLKLLPIKFLHNVIDVYIVSYYPRHRGISEPMIIRGDLEPNDFIDILTHEMIHFLSSNKIQSNVYTIKILEEMFPEEKDLKARNHIIIHAIQKYILSDVLKDDNRCLKNAKKDSHNPSYKKAWDIVEEKGYMEIINEFKNKIELSLNKK